MSEQQENKGKLLQRLRHRYRLVVMNDDTFEEKFSLRLTPLGLVILLSSVTILMVVLVTSLIAFTPLREYIPGYADVGMRRELISMATRSDSLEQALVEQNLFNENITNVLRGTLKTDTTQNRPDKSKPYEKLPLNASASEAALKKSIESQDQYSLAYGTESNKSGISNFFFFTPLKGIVTEQFKSKEQHYGVDIVGPENEPIKVALDGTVLLATWSSETGYTIAVQHSNNLVTVYKHNSVLLKKTGDYVKAGEAIAIIGNSGEQTTGPHLHFELWYNGNAIDPQGYMVF
ncbi:MAG TPA: M23 family metallopeptidase [Bacteroidia bacterium]|jgi:murein DD-endopeptidase MepM/ murein hydrolase activator NlpD